MITVNRFHSLMAGSLLCVSFSSLLTPPALADSFEPPRATVKFGDLDISHPQGAARLYLRIRAAAQHVCAPFDGSGLSAKSHLDACVNKAVADAVAKVGSPELSDVYSARTGRGVATRVASLQNR
jgi:UrcA family protein